MQSKHKSDFGKFVSSAGKYFGDEAEAKGIKTSEDAKNYALSARFTPFSNAGKKLIIQVQLIDLCADIPVHRQARAKH